MAKVTLKGNEVLTCGELPNIGSQAPDFKLVKQDLTEVSLHNYNGKQVILNIFPSIDTPTCATSVRQFNKKAASYRNTLVLCVSADLPFATGRFCGAEGIDNVEMVSVFRSPEFGKNYGVEFSTGPLIGLLSRAVIVIGEKGKVKYTEQVAEIADEPDYEAALNALK
jgi:thioredoxin-dependent peroxiredoxin